MAGRLKPLYLQTPFVRRTMNLTPWTVAGLVLLFASGLIFMVAFLTNAWGRLTVRDGVDYWNFGLWQCCRESDGKCIGPRWPNFYTASRMCGVLTILGNLLTFGWLLGYTLEKILAYDPCTLGVLIALNYLTVFFNMVTVCCFGARWPTEFEHDYYGTTTQLGYAFYLGCSTLTLSFCAGIILIIELRTSHARWLKPSPPEIPAGEAVSFITPGRMQHLYD